MKAIIIQLDRLALTMVKRNNLKLVLMLALLLQLLTFHQIAHNLKIKSNNFEVVELIQTYLLLRKEIQPEDQI